MLGTSEVAVVTDYTWFKQDEASNSIERETSFHHEKRYIVDQIA